MKKIFPLLFVACYLLFVSCAEMFQDKVSYSSKNNSLENFFRSNEEITKLNRPQQFYIAPYYSSTEIRLTWTEVRGAAYYMVERAEATLQEWQKPGYYQPDDGDYEIIDRFVYGTSYTDVILKTAALDAPEYQNKYFYRVSAFNTARNYDESEPTEPVSAMLFKAPANLRASGGESVEKIELRWERAAGADSYEIWRSDLPNGVSPSLLGIVYGNTWFNNMVSVSEQGKDFYYMVSARNGFGNKTPLTKPAYGYARVFGAPDKPTVRLAENSGRGHSKSEIKIEWNAADELDAYYAVYRYSSVDSSLTRLTERTTETNWPDSQGLKPGVYYYYKVQAIIDDIASGKALKSQFSSSDNLTESYILSAPGYVIAEKNPDGKVTVKWEPSIGSEGERASFTYNVYADKNKDGVFTTNVRGSVAPNVNGEGYICADGLSVDSGAFFKVSVVNSTSVESDKSAVISPSPAAAVIQGATQRAYFQNVSANSNGVYPVKITWKKPENEEPFYYNIQRSNRSGTGFSKINETELNANGPFNDAYSYNDATGIYTYIDKNDTAKPGKKFYYRVLSLNELKQGSFYSVEAIGFGALTHKQYILEYNKTMGAALKKLTLMYKSGSTDKLGNEKKNGAISGEISYNAALQGAGARIIIRLTNYADFYIDNEPGNGEYFILNGESNTTANMSSNGNMDGTVTCTGMYPGKIYYDNIQIKGGAAGGGTYGVEPDGGGRQEITYTVLN